MKLSKEELLRKVSERVNDEELSIELMEDISDSMEVTETNTDAIELETVKSKLEDMTYKYTSLQQRFKERFFEGADHSDEEIETENNVIDVKEI